jgi:uncharacterized Rossmann fold enzyme
VSTADDKHKRKLLQKMKLNAQALHLTGMKFHAEVAYSKARVANARRVIRQHLKIALRSIEADMRAVDKRRAKLGT